MSLCLLVATGCRCGEEILVSIPEPRIVDRGPEMSRDDFSGRSCVDLDGDGYGTGSTCLAVDCDDHDATVGGIAERDCYGGPADTVGVGACSAGKQTCYDGDWSACSGEVFPSAETCDGQDNDCDGTVDEEIASRGCHDGPPGTAGIGACVLGSQSCVGGGWSECTGDVLPEGETCDGADNDCDGLVDDEVTARSCYSGAPGTEGVGACASGQQACVAGAWGACTAETLPSIEVCDGVDNDCNGVADDALVRSCFSGASGTEGVGVCAAGVQVCAAGAWGACNGEVVASAESCDGVDNDCDGQVDEAVVRSCYSGPGATQDVGACSAGVQACSAGAWGACVGEALPGTESCDGVDNDCDGTVDEALVRSCFSGSPGTEGVGVCAAGQQQCAAGAWGACTGEVVAQAEVCDGADNDCDGTVDEALARSCYSGAPGTEGVGVCAAGEQQCAAGAWGACTGEVLAQAESCDALDNDCDGAVDEAVVKSCYTGPAGSDGVGACLAGTQTCEAGAWLACTGQVTPEAEACDGVDNDCDGSADEELAARACYTGAPGTEGVGQCAAGTSSCVGGAWAACTGEVLASAETCDGADNDCDGTVDEALARACYTGAPGTSGVGACASGTETCAAGAWGACVGEVVPAAETCDAVDNDCDGTTDEALVQNCYWGPLGTEGVGACASGTQTCSAGAWGGCLGQVLPAAETCDAVDNDCDGSADEALARACYSGPPGTWGIGVCASGTETCAAGQWGACAGQVVPSAESCDALDNDCDGSADEELVLACYPGPNGTPGVGVCAAGQSTCNSGAWGACLGAVIPSAETCDGADNNCNGQNDENITRYSRSGADQPIQTLYAPVDIIFVIDTSGSMADEIAEVEQNINVSFASIIASAGLDYRVIMLARHGTDPDLVCIDAPLSGISSCTQPSTCPVNGPRFFHYSVDVGSHDSFWKILTTYNAADACGLAPNGWSGWVRPNAVKYFVEITDDGPKPLGWKPNPNTYTGPMFDAALLALDPVMFGTAQQRNYVFHSIVGLLENTPKFSAWQPTDPLITAKCTGNGGKVVNSGLEYQQVSVLTGGLRYPLCQYQSFDRVFEELAESIILGTQITCSFVVPAVPPDSAIENTVIEMTPTNGGAVQALTHVASEADCNGMSFYTVGNELTLCPQACTAWQNDPTAVVEVLFTCSNQVTSTTSP